MSVVLFMIILIAVMIPLSLAAQQQQVYEIWNKTWNADIEEGYGIAVDRYIYVTGYTDAGLSLLLLKHAPDGYFIWDTWTTLEPHYNIGHDVVVDDNGYIYVAGKAKGWFGDMYDVVLLKYDPDENLIWSTTWGGSEIDAVKV